MDAGENELFGVENPIAADTLVRKTNNVIRATLLPSLLRCCKTNQDAGNVEVSLFELAKAFPPSKQGKLPTEYNQLALVTTRELRELCGAVELLVQRIAPSAKLEVKQEDVAGFAAGEAATFILNGKPFGCIGVVAANVQAHFGLERPLSAAGINFDAIVPLAGAVRKYQPLPKFPAVRRDLSAIVDEHVTWRQIEQTIAKIAQPTRTGIEYVITYRGKPIPAGKKSVTTTLTYRSSEATLLSEQVDQQIAEVVEELIKNLGAEIRK